MTLKDLKNALTELSQVTFSLPNGDTVPAHFHITEIGRSSKHFIDCGGEERVESFVNFQLWYDEDYDHRLSSKKLLGIIGKGQKTLLLSDDLEIEVEYQADTIGKYGLNFSDGQFHLTKKQTACLAEDACGIPAKPKVVASSSSCNPNSGCCC